ncbi:MAG: transposase [bacterium]
MPRNARRLYPNKYFHFIKRSNNHLFIFKDAGDFQIYLNLVRYYFKISDVKCFHYVLMNTHVHFVVKLPEIIDEISEMMKIVHLKYSLYYQNKYDYDGLLWRDRYKSELIDNDRYMLGCGLYIEHNPVKAGMVKNAGDYVWSSYKHWIGEIIDPLLSEHPLEEAERYGGIAEDYIEEYRNYVNSKSKAGRPRKSA